MQRNVLQQTCFTHQEETVAFDLDPLVERKHKFLCQKCLAFQSPYRQTELIQDAQQKFKEMRIKEYDDQKHQISQNLELLMKVAEQIKQFQIYFTNQVNYTMKALNSRIQSVIFEQNSLNAPLVEIQTEQDLVDLSNYLNFGFDKNLNRMNPTNYQFINQIKSELDYQKFYEQIQKIFRSSESIFAQSLIKEQEKFNLTDMALKNQKNHLSLRYQCDLHKSEIILICLEPGQVIQRLFCSICVTQKNQKQLTTIQNVNKLWQTHLKSLYTKNNNFHDLRQNQQDEINQLIVENQAFNSFIFERLQILQIEQNYKIRKETKDLYSQMINKQLHQMKLKEVEQVAQTLSQNDTFQEISQKQLQIQNEDQKYLKQIQEQLNLQQQKQLEILHKIEKMICKNDCIKNLNEHQIESQSFTQLVSQFYNNYTKFYNQYKKIIDYVKSKQEKIQQQNKQSQQNNQREDQSQKLKKILEQISSIEKIQLKQINLSINNLHINQKYKIKHSQNYQQINNIEKHYQFSDIFKHSSIELTNNGKIAMTTENNYTYAVNLFDKLISLNESKEIDIKINQLCYIMIGICKSKVIKKNFTFNNYNSCGHGFYVLHNDGYIHSHHDSQINHKQLGFKFDQGDIINVKIDQQIKQIIWRNKANKQEYALEFQPSEDLYFCCTLFSQKNKINEVEII